VVEILLRALAGAGLAASGAVLGAIGFRLVHFNAMTLGISLFAGLGAAIGAIGGSVPLAAVLTVAGAAGGWFFADRLLRVYVALMAGIGGLAVGALLALATGYSRPLTLCGATGFACLVIALLDARAVTIAWTSATGACAATLGVMTAGGGAPWSGRLSSMLTAGTLFAAFFVTAVIFQLRTTEPAAPSTPAPVRQKSRLLERVEA